MKTSYTIFLDPNKSAFLKDPTAKPGGIFVLKKVLSWMNIMIFGSALKLKLINKVCGLIH